jgi:hypothetical protein
VSVLRIVLEVPSPTSERLDRLLSHGLRVSRSRVQDLVQAGILTGDAVSMRALRRPVGAGGALRLNLDRLKRGERLAIESLLQQAPEGIG